MVGALIMVGDFGPSGSDHAVATDVLGVLDHGPPVHEQWPTGGPLRGQRGPPVGHRWRAARALSLTKTCPAAMVCA